MSKLSYFVDLKDVDTMGFDWGKLKITCSPEVNGAGAFSAGVVTMGPRQGHVRHNHPGAEEILFIISGTGEQMVEDENGVPIVRKVGPGCTIFIPADRYHSTLNTSDTEMSVFVVYSPAGPELALKNLPDYRLIPAEG
jgi:oxalate decarboxylase/phosphoglucose isomerase-like protein (cupin superfamily)